MPVDIGRVLPDSAAGCVICTVENFFSYPQDQDGYCIGSPLFSALGALWRLRIHPSVFVGRASRTRLSLWKYTSHPSVFVRFEFGIWGRSSTELIAFSGEVVMTVVGCFSGVAELPTHWRLFSDVLSVFCRIRERGAPPATPVSGNDTGTQTDHIDRVTQDCLDGPSKSCNSAGNNTNSQTVDLVQVSQDSVDGPSKSCNSPGAHKVVENLNELLSNEEACDITLKVQNHEFGPHKALLVARSSVFRAMFCHEMSEKLSNEVHITDCDPDAFRIFLKHAYTGEAEGLSASNAFNVFSVANKYDAPELKIQCKECIASNITVENVCEVISFSLLYNDSVLLEMASQFFSKHFSQILITNEWQCFFRDHATAANELLIRASKFRVPPE